MPPAISDEEHSDFEGQLTVPLRQSRQSRSADSNSDANEDEVDVNGDAADEEGDNGEEDEELDEDEFIVEAIKKHTIDEDARGSTGSLKFQVKWEGYESKNDLTWEPEENLKDSATDILEEYFEKIGGREKIFEETEKASKSKKRRRPTSGTPSTTSKRSRRNGAHPAEGSPPATAKKWSPPAGSWEDEIETIDACEEENSGKLVVYLVWKTGQKTKHDTDIIYKKCPQRMLRFYERHVKIIREQDKADAES